MAEALARMTYAIEVMAEPGADLAQHVSKSAGDKLATFAATELG